MLKLYSTRCPKCKVIKSKLEQSGKEFEVIEDLDELNKFAEEHDIREAPFMVDDSGKILSFKESLQLLK